MAEAKFSNIFPLDIKRQTQEILGAGFFARTIIWISLDMQD